MIDSYLEHIEQFGGGKNTQIERIDNSLGYSKENCCWATAKEQANNRRSSKVLTYKGESLTLKQWSERQQISYRALISRMLGGWSVEKALTTKKLINQYK